MASVTNTYARAFADAVMGGHLDAVTTLKEAQSLDALVDANRELREVWESPSIAAVRKRAVLDAIVAREGISPTVRNFVAVLIDHQRIPFFALIVEQFAKELDSRLGFVEAEIISARELGDAERGTLESQAASVTGRKIRARYVRDEAILGGAILRVGSTIYDGSVKGRLERIRQAIGS